MIKEAKRLHAIGYAIHWLKPNSKQPRESGWTKGDRKTVSELNDTYSYGFNLGVRLGAASKFPDDTYLTVIDCDVKSSDPKHEKELNDKLHTLLKGLELKTPQVFSGRGNGSKHLHVRTKLPQSHYRYGQSSEKVKVSMPSIQPSKFEQTTLTPDELKEGIRLRPAWEISVMGEGQQVVLPPSTHPDTGDSYEWVRGVFKFEDLPLVDLGGKPATAKDSDVNNAGFKVVDVDLVSSNLPNKIVDMILSGEGSSGDRSADLFTVAIAMYKERFSDDEILTTLTDPETYLGKTGYAHSNTSSRKRAADWVRKYTLKRAGLEVLAQHQFETEVETLTLLKEDAAKQADELIVEGNWLEKLDRTSVETGSKVKPTSLNMISILTNIIAPNVFLLNEFADEEIYGCSTPWGGKQGHGITDRDLVGIKIWLARKFKFEVAVEKVNEVVQHIAVKNKFHPVRDYLDALEWDGVLRLDTWLRDYMGSKTPEPYLSSVSRKVLCALVARVYEPGCKYDQVLILEGAQGVGKSSAIRILTDPWYTDAHINIEDKDAVLNIRSTWGVELGELSGMRKADANRLKEFISQQTDKIRVPYGRRTEKFPRQCVFIGTTNTQEYLKDTTGNRRFWPVVVGKCDFINLKKDRDQLFAEARFAYELGEKLYLENEREQLQAIEIQNSKTSEDYLVEVLEEFLAKKHENFDSKKFTLNELFSDFNADPLLSRAAAQGPSGHHRVSESLRLLGYRMVRERGKGVRKRYWVLPGPP